MPDGSAYFFTRHSGGYAEIGIDDEPALGSATHPEVNWNRFSSYWDTFRFRRRNATLVVSKGSGRRSMIESESSRRSDPPGRVVEGLPTIREVRILALCLSSNLRMLLWLNR